LDNLRIHPDTIEEVKDRVDIVDVISEYVVLKKKGKDYQGLCPFHQEKTPSFTVSHTKQMYYCFGCQAGGNAIKFLMEAGKYSFTETLLELARRYQISVRTLEPAQREELQRQISRREQLLNIVAVAVDFYRHALNQPTGKDALTYLQEVRGLSMAAIQNWQFGYAPPGWDSLYKYLVQMKEYPVKLVEAAGLILARKDDNGYYDRFRNRVLIPIFDVSGKAIGFGGRSLGDEQPKYLNSPETELFDKGRTLFALNRAKESISKLDKALVVEGYFDAISLHEAGITNTVACLGTALSEGQIKQLLRYCESKQVVLNFDADRAGITATQRAIGAIADLAYAGQIQLRILNLSGDKDADDFIKNYGVTAYAEVLENAPLWIDWQIEKAIESQDLNTPGGNLEAVRQCVRILAAIADPHQRLHYVQKAGNLLSNGRSRLVPLTIDNLQTSIKKYRSAIARKEATNTAEIAEIEPEVETFIDPDRELLQRAESLLLRIYLNFPESRLEILNCLDEAELIFTIPSYQFIWQKIIDIVQNGELELEGDLLIDRLQDLSISFPPEYSHLNSLFHLNEKDAKDIQRHPQTIRAAIACLAKIAAEKECKYYLGQWQSLTEPADSHRKQEFYQLFYQTKQKLRELEGDRHIANLLNDF
jgi:DNA primase